MTSVYEIHVVHLLRYFWCQDGWIWHNEQYAYVLLIVCLFTWCLTALSAQTGYLVP